ncbi:MAG: beta-galactosidase, partial [Burkholderiales bacterium]|nr:beta-galactosidase [Burkholderiales bacterium]
MKLGVCYYPEHWPQDLWADDARRMRAMGLSLVRIGEFAWSRIEPEPGRFEWAWLDAAIDTLHAHQLGVVLCTPTATPPKWLVDAHPDMLAVDAHGQPRGFGSRRHYCFSSAGYREQARRITREVAARYGSHPAVVAWQTDNEYGCHDTVLSASADATAGFRRWLARRYGSIAALNQAWGTVFWSQEYRGFDEIDLPVLTVTEANPTHRLDWRRFASDEVVSFNRDQVRILRELSPGRPVSHNFMGFFTEFNHHDVAADLDIATWDSYPLGFTQNFFLTPDEKVRWARTGHPDIPSYHHDLYRGMCLDAQGRGRWWVMEQQPGPVNWAQWNPAPLDGMVRLWTWQAFAHGAEVVSYFRWRQAPFAQEQMHSGLLRPDSALAQGAVEAAQVGAELRELAGRTGLDGLRVRAPVALVFDYDALWMSRIQPQGADYNALELSFRIYSALRGLGLDVDIVSPRAALGTYRLIVLPAQLHVADDLLQRLAQSAAQLVLAPRAGAKTAELHIPAELPPGPLGALSGVVVERVASLPPGWVETVRWADGAPATAGRWREDFELRDAQAEACFDDGRAAVARRGRVRSVAAWL